MLDATSRYTIATRMNEERLAEARRAHLLRTVREERDGYETKTSAVSRGGRRATIGAAVAAIRRGLAQDPVGGPHGAPAR